MTERPNTERSTDIVKQGKLYPVEMDAEFKDFQPALVFQDTVDEIVDLLQAGRSVHLIGDMNSGKTNVVKQVLYRVGHLDLEVILRHEGYLARGFFGSYIVGEWPIETFLKDYGKEEVHAGIEHLKRIGKLHDSDESAFLARNEQSTVPPLLAFVDTLPSQRFLVVLDEFETVFPKLYADPNGDPDDRDIRAAFFHDLLGRRNVQILATSHDFAHIETNLIPEFPEMPVLYTRFLTQLEVGAIGRLHFMDSDIDPWILSEIYRATQGNVYLVNTAFATIVEACEEQRVSSPTASMVQALFDRDGVGWVLGRGVGNMEWHHAFHHCVRRHAEHIDLNTAAYLHQRREQHGVVRQEEISSAVLHVLERTGVLHKEEDVYMFTQESLRGMYLQWELATKVKVGHDAILDYFDGEEPEDHFRRQLLARLFLTEKVALKDIPKNSRAYISEYILKGYAELDGSFLRLRTENVFMQHLIEQEKNGVQIAARGIFDDMSSEVLDAFWRLHQLGNTSYNRSFDALVRMHIAVREGSKVRLRSDHWFVSKLASLIDSYRSLDLANRLEDRGLDQWIIDTIESNHAVTPSMIHGKRHVLIEWGILVSEEKTLRWNIQDESVRDLLDWHLGLHDVIDRWEN